MAKKTETTTIVSKANNPLHKFKTKKVIIPVAIILIIVIVILGVTRNFRGGSGGVEIKAEPLTLRNLSNTISATGMVESTDKSNVYSQLSNPVKTIDYSVGDTVQEGDILCELDTESLKLDIAQQEATINASAQSAQHQINTSVKNYNYAQEVNDEDLDASVRNSRNAMSDSKDALEDADSALEDLDDDRDSASSSLSAARSRVRSSEQAKAAAQAQYDSAKKALEDADPTIGESETDNLQAAVEAAEAALNNATAELTSANAAYAAAQSTYNAADTAYENAKDSRSDTVRNYNDAQKSYEAAILSAEKNLESAKDNVTGSQIAANHQASTIALEKLNLQLEKSTIRSPISGTVTAVYATEGAPGNGLLFVIEDTENLKITTSIKEYDIETVKSGLPVTIKADATGDKEFEGTVSKIAPTAAKANDGSTVTGTNVQFDTEIAVTGNHEGLRVGMNTRVNIVLAERTNIFGVPYNAVVTDDKGNKIVYVAEPGEKGSYNAKAVPVTTGLETDFYIEIASDNLSEGVLIISNPDTVTDGAKVRVRK